LNASFNYVEASLNYLRDMKEKPVIPMYTVGSGQATRLRDDCYVDHTMPIHNARAVGKRLSLDQEGFMLIARDTAVSDFYDDKDVRSVYYPEVEQLIKDVTGACKAVIFDYTIRVQAVSKQVEKGVRETVRLVHNDYTDKSGPQRVRDLVDAREAEERLKHRFAVYNVWRPIKRPVQAIPLAVCNAQSVAQSDLVATDLDYGDRTGEIYQLTFNPGHRWFYFPHMDTKEVLIFKCYDSVADNRARFTPHTAFEDPTTPPDAPERESIEVRTLAFFPPEEPE